MASFKNNGKLKLLIIVGTRPEIIRLAAVITKCRKYFDCNSGAHGPELRLQPERCLLPRSGDWLTRRSIWMRWAMIWARPWATSLPNAYKLMVELQAGRGCWCWATPTAAFPPSAAKRLHIPIFHMEAGNRCKDECLPEETNRRIVDIISDVNMAYSEHARRYLADCGLPKERTYVTGSPMAEVLHQNLDEDRSERYSRPAGAGKGEVYPAVCPSGGEHRHGEELPVSLFTAINAMAEKYDMPILYSCHPRSRKRLEQSGFQLDERVIRHEPLGFHDYNCLQMNAFAVVSDSRHTAGGEQLLHLRGSSVPGGVHPHQH